DDILWVAGERQAQLAKRLGYTGVNLWYGLYCCDWDLFTIESPSADVDERGFLYTGRYVHEKGIDTLVKDYDTYRTRVNKPWTLYCIGKGSMDVFLNATGIKNLGFVQPFELPHYFNKYANVFILPSRIEPWGVVIQEAAASKLPIICSDTCGSV